MLCDPAHVRRNCRIGENTMNKPYLSSPTPSAEQPRRGSIPETLDSLEKELSAVSHNLDTLEAKMAEAGILNPEPPPVEVTRDPRDLHLHPAALANHIDGMANRLRNQSLRILDLINRLAF